MKIGILTLPLLSNYGGILQAYALQTILKREGHEVVLIDRRKGYPSFKELIYRLGSFLKCVIRIYIMHNTNYVLCNPFVRGSYNVKREVYYDAIALKSFIEEKIDISQPIYSTLALKKYVDEHRIDCFVVGSDQVWREEYSPCIENYFLDFLFSNAKYESMKKISYAASLGISKNPISAKKQRKCAKLLNKFNKVSVREISGKEYLANVFHCKSELVLDPTLLLPVEDYYKLMDKSSIESSGVVSYILDRSEEKKFIVSDLAGRLKLSKTELSIYPIDKNGNPLPLVPISEWLAVFANADFIVTDSFHGCVFSILFRKRFVVVGNKSRGIDRFYTLLTHLGLLDKLVLSKEEYVDRLGILSQPINYDDISIVLQRFKKQSLQFLLAI